MKNNDRFLSNPREITLLDFIFDVLTINGNLYWEREESTQYQKDLILFW